MPLQNVVTARSRGYGDMTVLQPEAAELIRVRGLVQGVGFRPTVWRLASRYGLRGWVSNDGGGVIVSVCGRAGDIENFVDELRRTPPPLARIEAIERTPAGTAVHEGVFRIAESGAGEIRTGVVPDAAICPACRAEILDPDARRYRYPFANCTHCGPRLSIIEAMPYDRVNTTMRAFRTCPACMAEYADPADRRFHAQPIACPDCGPRVWLEPPIAGEPVDVARRLLLDGQILAVKALGGFHLACDATDAAAVARLRATKRRDAKPFALMARDFSVIRRYAMLTAEAEAVLQSAAAPIVVLDAVEPDRLPGVAPGLNTLGFMLPGTPLHYLLLQDIDRPLVMTSGNESADPPVIDDREAKRRLSAISRYALMHDREIANRVDDSVVRVMRGRSRVFRRSRGFAPAPTKLPAGFEHAPELLAMGGELKATFCLVKDGQAILSQHQGDLENDIALFKCTRSRRKRAVSGHQTDRNVVTAPHQHLNGNLAHKFGSIVGDDLRLLQRTRRLAWNPDLLQSRQRSVHGCIILSNDRFAVARIGLTDRLLDLLDRIRARQNARNSEKAGLQHGVDTCPETDLASDLGSIDHKEAQPLVDDPLLYRARQLIPNMIGIKRAVQKKHRARCGEPQNILTGQKAKLVASNESRRGDQIGSADRFGAEA
jgi:hydrogenase maturation protein HypF